MKPGVKANVLKYWGGEIFYSHYMLSIIDDIVATMKAINETFKVKDYNMNWPDVYLGCQLTHMDNSSGEELGHMS